jgi:hypothetical protein
MVDRGPHSGTRAGLAHTLSRSQLRQRHIPPSSCTSLPEIAAGTRGSPQVEGAKAQLKAGIPAHLRSARKYQDRPVTPEVAGSSPVAPATNTLLISGFCCLVGRERPPAFFASR